MLERKAGGVMDTRTWAKRIVVLSNGLLGASLLLVLVWWPLSLRLFAAGCVLSGVAWLMSREAAIEHAALAMPERLADPL